MKYTKTTLKELTRQYAIVLKKCAILNMLVLAGSLCAAPALADLINLDETYPDGVVSGNLVSQSGETASLNTETVDVSGVAWARKGSSLLIGDQGKTNNVTVTAPSWTVYADTNDPAKQSLVNISANDTITVSTTGYGVSAMAGGRIDLKGKVVNIEATGAENGDPRAIISQNNTTNATDNFATVNITADQINLTAENGIGISAMSQGRVNLIGDTTIKAKKAIVARGDAVVNINKDGDHVVKMDGDISFDYHKNTSGTKIDALVDVTLSGDESYWNGNTVAAWSGEAPDESYLKVSSSNLTLKNGATWNAAKIIDSGDNTEGSKYAALNNLNIEKGNVNILDTERGIVVENVKAQDAAFSSGSLTVLNELTAENSTFKDSVSERDAGGALLNEGTTTITGGSFENNVIENKSSGYAYGGALYNDGQMTIDNVAFTGNSIDTNGIGGAFFVGKDSETTISNSTFDSNKTTWGGAGYTSTNAKQLTITDSRFTNNEAAGVGALGIFSKADLTNVSFSGNRATDAADDGAGALFLGAVSQTTITGGTFENNTSASVGGAIATRSGSQASNVDAKLDIVDTVFKNNTAGKSGGAIYNAFYSSQTDVSNVWIDNSTFEGNIAAEDGGAIYNDGATDKASNHTSMHLGKVTFSQNEATGQGGAIYNGSTLTIDEGEFTGNSAGEGGAIYNEGTLTIDGNATFADNTANGVANDVHNTGSLTFNGNTSFTGGVTGEGDIVFNGDELDIGSSVIQGSSISIKDGSTLRANLLSGTAGFDAATLSGDNLNLVIEQGALGGSLVFAQGNGDSLTFVNDNNLFDIVVQDGNVVIGRKATDSVVDQFVSTGVMDETTAMGVVTMTEAKATTPQAQALAAAIVELAQSKDMADQQKAGELAKAAQPTRAPIRHAVTTNTQVLKTASTRMAQLRQGRSGGDLAQAKLSPWVRGLFNKNHNSQGDGFDAYTHGFAFGVDAQVSEDWLVGLGYARTTSTVKEYNRRTHINGDNYFLYGKYQPAQWYVESTLNYGHNKNKVEAVGLTSDYSIDTYGAQLFSGYQYGIADNYAGIRYTYVKPDKYNNGLNMVNEKNTQVATAVIGTRIAKEFQYSDSVAFKPEFRLAGTYDFKSDNSVANVNVIGGNTLYSVDGRRLHRAALESGVGLTAKYGKMELSADYDIEWRVSNFAQTGMLKLKYNF